MAEFDLTKQMEEAAKERSNIAKTLLAIQQSLDKLAPTMLKMEPVLASLEPAVNNLSAWRPRVDAAVGQLPNDLSDTRKQLEKIALAPFRTSKASDPSSSTAVDARTPATCSIKVPDHNTGDEDPGVMSLLPGSTPTSLISSPEDSPSPPLVALEVTTLPSTTCSAKCSSSIIGSPASAFRITHATPTWLLPAPASMLGPELWPTQPCWLFVVLELDTKSSSRCSTTCLINNTELFTYMPMADVIQSIMRPRQGLRPRPWPSFTSDNTAHDPTAYLGESAGTDEAEYTWKPLFGTQGNSQTNVFIPLGETRGNKGRWLSCSGSMTFNWYPQEEFAEILPVTTSSRVLQVRVGPCRQLTSEVCEEVFLLQPKLPQSPLLISRVVAVQNPVYTMINLCVRFVYGLQLQLGSDTISNMEVSLEYVYNKCFIFQSSAGLKFDVDFRGYLTTVLVDNNTLSCSLLCLSSAYASHGNNSTIQSNSALLQWEIAWFSWMGALHPELLWCILGQENGGKDGAHMTYVGGLASTVLSTQCSVSAYHDGLGDQCNGGFLSKITSALANRLFLVVLLPLDPSDFVTVTSDVWVLERLHPKIVKCLLVYLTVQQTVSIAQAETISSLRFFWDTCGSLQAAQKRMKIKKPPNILVFNLRQFTYIEQLGRYKNLAYQVALPLEHKLVNIVDHSDLESSLLAGQPIPCAFKLNQWNIASILDWDCYASTSDLHAVLLDTAVQLQSAAPSSDHSGGYLALLRLLALRPVQIAAEVCDSKSNSFASVVLLFGHKRSMSKQGMEQARAIFDALPSPQRHRTGTSMQGLAIGSVLKICRRVATPSFLMAGLLATRIQLMYFCQAVCLSEEIARETAISTEDFSINQVDIRHKYDCLVLKEKTRTKSLLELTVTMLTSRGNAGTMCFTDTSVHWPFLRKEEFEGIGNYSGDGMIVPQSAKGIAQPCYMVEFGYTTNSSSCVNCRNKYIVDVNLSAHSVGEIVSLKLIQIGVVLSLGSKSCCGGPLEQLWDPGGNNSSVLLSSSLDEIALYRRILIDGQNPVDTLQLLSSCELAPFQGGRRIIVSAFVDHDYYLNAFVDKILFIHANYQVQACTDHDDHLDFVQAHLNHYYYQEGYHGDLGGTKKHPTPWDPGGCSPMSAWGQAEFEGGGNVTGITQQAHNEMPRPAHKAQVESDLIYIEECIASGGDHRWITELAAPLGVYLPPTPWLYISIPFLAATNSIPMYQ